MSAQPGCFVRRFAAVAVGSLCLASASCSTHREPLRADAILLGADDTVRVPKNRSGLDDYTCGARVMVCEDYVGRLRCGCARSEILDTR